MAYPPAARVAIGAIFLNVLFVGFRVWARVLQRSRWTWADTFVPVSLILNLTLSSLFIVQTLDDRKNKVQGPPSVRSLKLSALWIPMVYGIASAVPKLAVLDTYLKIFMSRWVRYALLATGFVIVTNAIVYIPTTIFQCAPVQSLWDHSIPNRKCNNIRLHYSLAGVPNILTDAVMLILPLPIIWKLQMDKGTKAGVLATFASGGIGLVASLTRFLTMLSWSPNSNNTMKISIATMGEVSFYLIAACLLSMRPLIAKFLGRAEVVSNKYFWPRKKTEARWDLLDDGDDRQFMLEKEKWDALDDGASTRQLMLDRGGAKESGLQTVVVGVVEEVRKPEKIKVASKFDWRR